MHWQLLPAPGLEASTVSIPVNAITLSFTRAANQVADYATRHRAYCRPAPTIGDYATNYCAASSADCGTSLSLRAGGKRSNNSHHYNKVFHGGSSFLEFLQHLAAYREHLP